ncbi:hypothetical protein RB195_021016 [Necator americanus]|uniref:Secreted protein n=1 Tax=Necator americanus TaxID=51031 RepID=A0ABR1CNT5_NECAM
MHCLVAIFFLLCCINVSPLLCNSERSANITFLSLQEIFAEVESLTCFMKVHYDLGSRQVFLVELYGLEEEDDQKELLG